MTENTKLLQLFKLHLLRKGNRSSSAELKVSMLSTVITRARSLDVDAINAMLMQLAEQGRSTRYLNSILIALRDYGDFAKTDMYSSIPYFKDAKPNTIRATLSDQEIEGFLTLPRPPEIRHKSIWASWTLFFTILAYSGMRPGEVASLITENVDFGRGVFVLPQTKTNPRYVPIAPNLIPLIEAHIKGLKGDYIFPAQKRGKSGVVGKESWRQNFDKRIALLGLKRANLSTYSLRHSFITRMIEEDINLFAIQKIVGHKRSQTTEIYSHLTTKDIIRTIKKDRMAKKDLTPQEIVSELAAIIRGYGVDKDPRFTFTLQEQENGIFFEASVKKPAKPSVRNTKATPSYVALRN